jgi:NAD(P)-dependent dehydrogenase (short-subunit alcohol dehydrogenase family)
MYSNLTQEINEQFGGIDILINNVGGLTTPGGGFSTLTDEHWENELQLNLLAAIRLDRVLLPQMIEQKSGVIIHISSVAGKQALWNLNMAYAVSKAALNLAIAKHWQPNWQVKVYVYLTVSPGATKTPPMEKFRRRLCNSISRYISRRRIPTIIAARPAAYQWAEWPNLHEVASLVHFLVSPAAAYLTGTQTTLLTEDRLPVVS